MRFGLRGGDGTTTPLAVGTPGEFGFTVQAGPPVRVRARTYFRDYDGTVGQVTKFGPSKASAERALKIALRDRTTPGASETTGDTKVETLGQQWLGSLPADRTTNTRQTYEYTLGNYVLPALGALRVREVGTPAVDRVLKAIRVKVGPGAAKSSRSVLSGMFGLAVRHGAVTVNPVREAASVAPAPKQRIRALTRGETDELMDLLRSHQWAIELDIPDLVDFMLGTGVRIGEACAVRRGVNPDGEPLLDVDHATVEINATIVRIKGSGLHIQQWPKTDAGWRRLALPPYLVAMVERRSTELRLRPPQGAVFASPMGHLRDPSNTTGDLREVLDGTGCERCAGRGLVSAVGEKLVRCDAGPFSWVTSHVFRKTVATRLDEAGLSARQIADQLGHARPSLTHSGRVHGPQGRHRRRRHDCSTGDGEDSLPSGRNANRRY